MHYTHEEHAPLTEAEALGIIIEVCLSQDIYYKNGRQKNNTTDINEALRLLYENIDELREEGVIR
ncbi:conserved hypothetical protein [Vibrio crassostreae]|nr:conserved hypothetical protein [Vibrio crassostreae]